jgi:hypothetical protein
MFSTHLPTCLRELAQFLQQYRKELGLHASYLVSGDVSPPEDEMDVDDEEYERSSSEVAQSKFVMVTEEALESMSCKPSFLETARTDFLKFHV